MIETVYKTQDIHNNILKDDKWLYRGIVALYRTKSYKECDDKIFNKYYVKINKGETFSVGDKKQIRNIVIKYSNILCDIANNNIYNREHSFDKLLDYQKSFAEKSYNILKTNDFLVDGSDTGTGKTYVSISVLAKLKLPIFVICPKIMVKTWENTLLEFGISNYNIVNYEKLGRGNTIYGKWVKDKKCVDEHFVFTNKVSSNSIIVFDEVHKCKGRNSNNCKILIGAKKQNFKIYMLSATIATNPSEMLASGYVMNLHNLKTFRQFCSGYGCVTNRFGGVEFDMDDPSVYSKLEELHKKLFSNQSNIGVRMKISELGDMFPKNKVIADVFDCGDNTDKINKVYLEMERELAKLEESTSDYSDHIFSIITKARRKAEILKVPVFVENIVDLIEEKKSVVVFVNYTDTVDMISSKLKKLNINHGFIVGGQKTSDREQTIQDFQDNKLKLIICNMSAGNVGISLHDIKGNSPRVTLISPNYSAIQFKQTIGRCVRAKSKSDVVIQKVIFAANTIEENICRKVRFKLNCLDSINDGDFKISKYEF
jgi:superfamily II DNA or RNA helicase